MNPLRLLAVSAALVICLLASYTGYMVYEDYRQSRERVITDAVQLTQSIAQQAATNMEKAELLLEQIAANVAFLDARPEALAAYAARLASIAERSQEIELVGLLDSRGQPIGTWARAFGAKSPYLPANAFDHHRRHDADASRVGIPLRDPVTHRAILPISKRISGTSGEFLGVVVVGVSLAHLQEKFADYHHAGDSRVLLIDKAGNVLIRHPAINDAIKVNTHAGQHKLGDYIDQHESGHVDAPSPFDGIVRNYTFRHIPASPLVVVYGETIDQQLDDWRARTNSRLGFLAVTLILLGLGIYYINQLIRRSRAAHDALAEALAKASGFELALHQHAMVSRADVDDYIIGANEKFCEISGFSQEELVGKTHRVLNSGEHPPEFFAALHETIKDGKVWTGDICNKSKQGDFFWTRSTIVPFRNAAGQIYEYVAVRTDISELKFMQRQIEIANESLAASFDLLYATVNSSASGIITTDRDGIIVMMNAAAEQMLGYRQQDVESTLSMLSLHDLLQMTGAILAAEGKLATDLEQITYEALAVAVAASPEREWVYLTSKGETLPVSISISPLMDRNGDPQGYVTSFNDLTRLKQVEVMKSDFVSMVSHELRTPLTSIKGALTLLDKMAESALPANQQKLLNIGMQNCESLVNLVSDILDFDKITRNAMIYEMQVHDARTLLEKAVNDTQPYATQFNVTYWMDRDDHELPILADAPRFQQILRNLLSNAAKFSHAGSEVLVSAHAEAGVVTISVADQGVGIPDDFQAKIFQKFSQVSHSDRPTKVKGTGLGLSIAKMMIEAHGGSIDFRSTEGVGTTFFIKLPLKLDAVADIDADHRSFKTPRRDGY